MANVNLLSCEVLWIVVPITPAINTHLQDPHTKKLSSGVKNCKTSTVSSLHCHLFMGRRRCEISHHVILKKRLTLAVSN